MNHELGNKGETLAVHYLRRKGWTILERNWRAGRGEIDLIAQDGGTLVFVEVKTRSTDQFGDPERALTWHKRRMLEQTANHYLKTRKHITDCRYDLLAIVTHGTETHIQHFPDAFWPGVFT